MKRFLVALVMLTTLAPGSVAADLPTKVPTPVAATYDKATDTTTVQTREIKVIVGKRTVTAQAMYSYPGKDPRRPTAVTFRWSAWSTSYLWPDDDGFLYVRSGGKTQAFPIESLSGGAMGGALFINMAVQIPCDTFETIFSARQVDILLQGRNDPPVETPWKERYPLASASLAPFQELVKDIPPSRI